MSARVDQQQQAFQADSSNAQAFAALEEHFFMAGNWQKLVALYEHRLTAPALSTDHASMIPILFRLAQIVEERCLDHDRAIEIYWKVAKLDPRNRPALRQLRTIYSTREQWDLVLRTSEMEGQLEMEPHERASFLADLGNIWSGKLNDPTEALAQYQAALDIAPEHSVALTGLARIHEGLGHHQEAAAAWERLSNRLRGPDRAPVLVSLGTVLAKHLDQADRAIECFRLALIDDARCAKAANALFTTATQRKDWAVVAEMCDRRFDIASGARERTEIAVEAGHIALEKLDDTQGARLWFDRALELSPDGVSVFHGVADLERLTGNREALSNALERVIALGGDDIATSILLESADLYSESGQEEAAAVLLRRAQERLPNDIIIAETLSDALSNLGHTEELVTVLERRAALTDDDPQAESKIRVEIARIHLEDLRDADTGIASLARAFELDPCAEGVASKLESLYSKRESWAELQTLLDRASTEGPTHQRVHFLMTLGGLHEQQFGNNDAAVVSYEAALALESNCNEALQALARINQSSGNQDDYLRICEREAEITADRTRLSELVAAMVPMLEERGRTDDALRWLEKQNELVPDQPDTLRAIIGLLETLEQHEKLQGPLERLARVLTGSEQTSVRLRLAELHRTAGRNEESTEWYQATLENDPNHLEALQSLKVLYKDAREFEELARTMRRLADVLPPSQRNLEEDELAHLLVDQLGDLDGAIVILCRLAKLPGRKRPDGIDERLETLLERAGRFEELAQQLLERRETLDDAKQSQATLARTLDTKRAQLLLQELRQFEEAAALFKSLRAHDASDPTTTEGLKRSLRLCNDTEGLVELLEELAREEPDPTASATIELERAALLEQTLGAFDEARDVLTELANVCEVPEMAVEANAQLERLLNRCGDWEALRELLTKRLGVGNDNADLALHEKLARLCRDRLDDRDGSIEHFEAAGKLAPERHAIWQSLSILYSDVDRNEDVLRVTERELALDLDAERETMLCTRATRLSAELPGQTQGASKHYERLLAIDPGHAQATEFLLDFYERENQPEKMVVLLRRRLDACLSQTESNTIDSSTVLSLRLRIAAIEADTLDNLEAAVSVLEPVTLEVRVDATVSRPLADLYLRLGRREDFVALARRAADACDATEERASWMLEVGDTLREDNQLSVAADAYRDVYEACPENLDAQSALRELYRKLGTAGPLAELLELESGRHSGDAAIPALLERATLLAGPLEQHEEALTAFEQILEAQPNHPKAFVFALHLTRDQARYDATRVLLERGLANTNAPSTRALLLEQQANLTAGPLDDALTALGLYREASSINPSSASVRENISTILAKLERWNELLDCLFLELQHTTPDAHRDIIERAINIATREISKDAALPWLDRLLALDPEDASVHAQVANVHREAGRHNARLRALEAQLPFVDNDRARHDLHREIASVLEGHLDSPTRAAQTLYAALEIDLGAEPDKHEQVAQILADLDRLYAVLGRHADRVKVIEERIHCPGTDATVKGFLHVEAATLWHKNLRAPELATQHLLHCIELLGVQSSNALPLICQLQETLKASGRLEGWARAGEAELALLNIGVDPADDTRRIALHRELASRYEHDLGRPVLARQHLLALIDSWDGAEPLSASQLDGVECALLDHLRRERNHVELARRLHNRVYRIDAQTNEWLELARLEAVHLHRPTAARRAYRQVLERNADNHDAIFGLRSTSESLYDWRDVAESYDRELAHHQGSEDERCKLLRILGDVTWHKLEDDEALGRAVAAFGEVLSLKPNDMESLHNLQQIEEQRAAYTEAIARFEQEIELLGDADAERRQFAWLRVAELSRDKLDETNRAIQAFENAAEAFELKLPRVREWSELYRTNENWDRFAEVFGQWCDAPGSPAGCADILVLSQTLEDLDRKDEALERAEAAIRKDARRADAWERAASLREERGDANAASDHWAEAAELRDATSAAKHLLRAAALVDAEDPNRAAKLLNRGADHNTNCQETQARLAIVCERLEQWSEASAAAMQTLYLNVRDGALKPQLLITASLAGGRAAWRSDDITTATELFQAALKLEPKNIEAADAVGELLYITGDKREARKVLEARLALSRKNTKLARQHAIIGEALELDEEFEQALGAFSRAIEVEADIDQGHEGIARIHELRDEPVEAIGALLAWTQVQSDDTMKSAQLFRVARLEQSIKETDAALTHLREATEASTENTSAWTMLAELLLKLDQPDEAIEASSKGLDTAGQEDTCHVARLSFVRAEARAQVGDDSEALIDYAAAVTNDPTLCEAALAHAKLHTKTGDWQLAADSLGEFIGNHPEPTRETLAVVLYERAQLLAGPLERVEEAIACYERAIEIDPDFTRAIAPLANLLSHFPERWGDSVKQHATLLAEDPARDASIRSLLRICDGRSDIVSRKDGLTILRALGKATPDEILESSRQIGFEVSNGGELADPHGESLRLMLTHVSAEIADALASEIERCDTAATDAPTHAGERDFWNLQRAAECELSAMGFDVLPTELLGQVVTHVASLALDGEGAQLDDEIAQQLERTIGRWTRRKLRKTLEGTTRADLDTTSWKTWRNTLQELAALAALDRSQGELRHALLSLSADPEDMKADPLPENESISDRVRNSNPARSLLATVVQAWISQIGCR
ncbi:MAG TPA: tetratricopeptide repeat protein [Myxococcales bacterium]|nr:tetratricopeptide repeat protein [Myxococcales bacterium]